MTTSKENRAIIIKLAHSSIKEGLEHGQTLTPDFGFLPAELQQAGACFVTLEINNQLRGCVGSLEAHRPLAEDVARNAYNAAFRDPRFPQLTDKEYPDVTVKLSLLTAPTPMQFNSEEDLVNQLQPNIDGLILKEGFQRGTFLPSVWEQLPSPQEFLNRLKQKAGFPLDYWSNKIEIERYHTEQFY